MEGKVSFIGFIASLANAAFAYMHGFEDPQTKEKKVDLEAARQMIDTIDMLKEKTKGNLTDEEERFLENVLFNLKMSFVKITMRSEKGEPGKEEKGDEDRGDS